MLVFDEDALICDFAETYHVYDWRRLPLRTAASLACGLRDTSRIKMKMTESTCSLERLMIASIRDSVAFMAWANTTDGLNGQNRPTPVLNLLLGEEKKRGGGISFDSGDEFDAMYKRIARGE